MESGSGEGQSFRRHEASVGKRRSHRQDGHQQTATPPTRGTGGAQGIVLDEPPMLFSYRIALLSMLKEAIEPPRFGERHESESESERRTGYELAG